MNPEQNQRLLTFNRRGGWVVRVLLTLAALLMLVMAAAFLTFALVAGALVALVVGVRWWWTLRKLRAQAKSSEALEGEYTVVERVETFERPER